MNVGDFIYIDYVARIKDTGEIFDLTKEDVAKAEGIFNPKFRYGPVPIILGAKFAIKGLEEALKEMKVGEKRSVEIPPESGFGKRDMNLIKLVPLSNFKSANLKPEPGKYVVLEGGLRGRIISISGGRVKIDFNHPLAEKTLKYDVEIKSEIKEPSEKVKAIVYYYLAPILMEEIDVKTSEREVEIMIKKKIDVSIVTKKLIVDAITKWVKDIEKVKFIDVFEK
jgi:FKBP-type peptidyl-prolyl cis-trans isomerase 2